ncbi:O-antigen ligase family protein [Micromonospora pisi]|uniref:O-antigen ligase family protein n=1 Tax=Micromonospora pisi TaxID=589240 RepID=UPI001476E6B6|nr:O-antigen ligase family protein [Micromonospora pisi]
MLFALAVPQFYFLPQGTMDIALSSIVAILLVPTAVVWAWRNLGVQRLLRTWLMYGLLGLLAARILALLWSPDAGYGRLPMVLLAQFIMTLVLMYGAASEKPDFLRQIQFFYWPLVMLQTFLVALFRVFPGVEDAYLRSIAGLFAGQNTVSGLFDVNRNNVLDPTKSGGVFINANVAGLFLGVSAMAAFAVWSRTRQRLVLVAGVVALTGVWFTGSKSGRMFAVVLPLAALAAYFWRRLKPALRRYLLIGAGVATVGAIVLLSTGGGFATAVRGAFGQRTDIWGYGAEAFVESPLLGLGWGGWQEGFAVYAAAHGIYSPNFPPHNILLAAWASTGLVGLVLTILVFGAMLGLVVKAFKRSSDHNSLFVAWTGAAFVWVIVQAMGENTDVFGEIHLIPVLALLLCYLIDVPRQETTDRVTDADFWNRETSIIPAIRDVYPEPGHGNAYLPPPVYRAGPGDQGPSWHQRP